MLRAHHDILDLRDGLVVRVVGLVQQPAAEVWRHLHANKHSLSKKCCCLEMAGYHSVAFTLLSSSKSKC